MSDIKINFGLKMRELIKLFILAFVEAGMDTTWFRKFRLAKIYSNGPIQVASTRINGFMYNRDTFMTREW